MEISNAIHEPFVLSDAPAASPGSQFLNKYASSVFGIPGAKFMSASAKTPDQVAIHFTDEMFARMADNVLQDAVDGVKINLQWSNPEGEIVKGTPKADPKVDNFSFSRSSVMAMPGVYRGVGEIAGKIYNFFTVNQETADHLKPILSPEMNGYRVSITGLKPRDGIVYK